MLSHKLSILVVLIGGATPAALGGEYSWQKPHARVLSTGDLEWAPEPYAYEPGNVVRYIDYESGDDADPGTTKGKPWKHHPWDKAFRGAKDAAEGVDTFVFKRGVVYRGSLSAYVAGTPDAPIRLTSDPAWGKGDACIYGSEPVTGWKRGTDHPAIPDGKNVWYADIRFKTRAAWMVGPGGRITRLRLARTPNWRVSDRDDVMSEWWSWQNPEWWKDGMKNRDHLIKDEKGKTLQLGIDPEDITRDPGYYEGAIVWTEWGVVMGTPYPRLVEKTLPKRHALAFNGPFYGIWGLFKGHRYFLEDKPHYLDEPGEYWFEPKGGGGRLHVRLPKDADPTSITVEAARRRVLIDSDGMKHVRISGLTFRFTDYWWQLWAYPFGHKDAQGVACIRVLGSGEDIRISHCRFEHVSRAVRMAVEKDGQRLDRIAVTDSEIRHADHSAVWIRADFPNASLGRVDFLRNHLEEITLRAQNNVHCHAVYIQMLEMGEFAGNMLERIHAGGIFLEVVKSDKDAGDAPFARVLVHHNKVVDPLLEACDWGGIEVNQGGPAYIYNNVVRNPGGFHHWKHANRAPNKPVEGTPRFGHAYYIDGSFKKYLFNNIAWGKNNTPGSKYANCSAFQEIIGFENAFFNNSAYRFVQSSRRQAPEAGRNKYLGNVFQDVSQFVFRHADEKARPEVNAADAGKQKDLFDLHTLAYAGNVFHGVTGKIGMFEPTGEQYATVNAFRAALRRDKALVADLGVAAEKRPLRDPANSDFRPAAGSAAIDRGVRVFVPWGLYGTVGEWHFTRKNADPTRVIDEHWYMTDYFGARQEYKNTPRYPLTVAAVKPEDYIAGPLEDWADGALTFDGKARFARIADETFRKPVTMVSEQVKSRNGITRRTVTETTFEPRLLKTLCITTGNVIVEAYFRLAENAAAGTLVGKMGPKAGYALDVAGGKLTWVLAADGRTVRVTAPAAVGDGKWHHVIAECDRGGKASLYVDGRLAASAACDLPAAASLDSPADFVVAKGLACTVDFVRVARGTLADAQTTIEELHSWQFDGPFLRDFTGRKPADGKRDAGAIEAFK